MPEVASGRRVPGKTDAGMRAAAGAPDSGAPIARPCDVCGKESAVWGPGVQRCADHFDFDHHEHPALPDPKPREQVLDLFAKARAAGRLSDRDPARSAGLLTANVFPA